VYVSYACPNVFGFSLTGSFQWQFPNPLVCSGGGGKTAAYGGGLLYARDSWNSGFVLDAATGLQVATFPGGTIPAVAPGAVFYNNLGTLRSVDPATQAVNWSFSGDGQLVTAPLVVDEAVIVGSATGNLYAVDTLTGTANWQVKVASFLPAPDEQNVSQPLTGLGIAGGLLVVPAGSTLSAYQIFGPPAATALVATGGAGSVNLSWSAAASADSYNVYMGGASRTEAPVPILRGVKASAAVVPNLIAGTRYYFRVKAVSAAGISAPSNEVSAVPHNPSPASGLAATADIAGATLAWTASPEARTYSIYQGTSSGGEAAVPVMTNVVVTTVKITNLTIGTPYYFLVKAEAYGSLSTASNEARATPLPPPAPTGVQAKSGDGSVTLNWSAAAGAASYDVHMGTSAAGESSMPVVQGVSALTVTVTGLTNGTTYFFYVRSQTPQGASDPSAEVSARPAAPPPASSGSGGSGAMGSREIIGLLFLLALQMATRPREQAADRQAS
jgi:hypothetical protein